MRMRLVGKSLFSPAKSLQRESVKRPPVRCTDASETRAPPAERARASLPRKILRGIVAVWLPEPTRWATTAQRGRTGSFESGVTALDTFKAETFSTLHVDFLTQMEF